MARLNPEEVLERLRSTAPEANFEHRNLVLVGVQRSLYSWALFLGSLEYLLDLENGLFLSLLLGVSALCFQQAQRLLGSRTWCRVLCAELDNGMYKIWFAR